MLNKMFPWSDNWWIEKDLAWFCAQKIGAVFCVDLMSQQCELVTWFPEHMNLGFREYCYCIKQGDFIFCLPGRGNWMWVYNIKRETWDKIKLEHEYPLFIYMNNNILNSGRIWLVEGKSGKIYEITLREKKVVKIYHITEDNTFFVGQYVLISDFLFCVCGVKIYSINIYSGEINTYIISGAKAELYTICFDGNNFWLSGHCKEIYIWNLTKGLIKIINKFPKQFGLYHFADKKTCLADCDSFFVEGDNFFIDSVSMGEYVWFIPDQANEILYINKKNYSVSVLEIEEEQETMDSLKRHLMPSKYLVLYKRENRYIGLYSLKNYLVFEIDTVELCINKRKYYLSNEAIKAIFDIYYKNNKILFEGTNKDAAFFTALVERNINNVTEFNCNIGKSIYNDIERKVI